MTQQSHPPRKRGGRRARKIIVVLVVLVGLLVAADFGAAAFAEHTVSQKAREQLGLTEDPNVTIHGFPFTTQALGGEYDHITVSADGVPVGDMLNDVGIRAELREVTAPLSDLTSGNTDNITIGDLEGQITLKASDIGKVSPLDNIKDLSIEPSTEAYVRNGEGNDDSQAGDDTGDSAAESQREDDQDSTAGVRLSGKVDIAGQEIEIFAFAMIELDGTSIRITPHRLQFGNDQETTVVPPEVQQRLLPNFEADINTGDLPFTVTPTAVKVEPGSLTISGEAKDVAFAGVTGQSGR
ncbi:LmeA family phospholipid-binding protein [Prauserella cavernicola]|uniref:DUF2993 domain-containing protein n=1 Tax=Prauserella cavernicola TaxID=2800127 RepID=A0A934QRD4_9PSEU|nr:DUF2993 domain-containing protein [Prauserella cavernicola]MBK1784847.1 DUF2993 domain-containing protein [Prauserella cavernicola]